MQPLGSYLKSEREKRGIQLEEIASSTKIHIHNLILMEEDRWKELPQEPFIRGFISAYARYVGLDNKETLKLFSQYQGSQAVTQQNIEAGSSSHTAEISGAKDTPSPAEKVTSQLKPLDFSQLKLPILGAGVVLLLTIIIVNVAKSKKEMPRNEVLQTQMVTTSTSNETTSSTIASISTISTIPSTPETSPAMAAGLPENKNATTTVVSPNSTVSLPSTSSLSPTTTIPTDSLQAVPQAPPSQASAPIAMTPPVEPPKPEGNKPETTPSPISGHEIVVESKNRSWMKVVIDDEPPKESYLDPDVKLTFQAKDKIKLVLGNATAVSVLYNGKEAKGNKFAGTVRYYIFPKGSKFPQEKPKPKAPEEKSGDETETNTPPEESTEKTSE